MAGTSNGPLTCSELLPSSEFPFKKVTNLFLEDGTDIGRVLAQFGDTPTGFTANLTVYFPVTCPEELFEHHRRHFAVEFSNWMKAAAALHPCIAQCPSRPNHCSTIRLREDYWMNVEGLVDRAEIHDVLVRYSRGLDRVDMALVRDAFHDDAWIDFPDEVYVGPVKGFLRILIKGNAFLRADSPQSGE